MLRKHVATSKEYIRHREAHYRHWCAISELYPPAEVLLPYLRHGWQPEKTVFVERFPLTGYRFSAIYHFKLRSDDQPLEVPVLANPTVFQVIERYHLAVSAYQPFELLPTGQRGCRIHHSL
jgi:hypothetical protein